MTVLLPIKLGPQPSKEELEPYLVKYINLPGFAQLGMAEADWRKANAISDADYPVGSATQIKSYPPEIVDYQQYTESNLWRRIRRKALKSNNYICVACENKATQVHHRDYRLRVLTGEDTTPLVPMCRSCHKALHALDDTGAKPSWHESERRLAEMVARDPNQ